MGLALNIFQALHGIFTPAIGKIVLRVVLILGKFHIVVTAFDHSGKKEFRSCFARSWQKFATPSS
jgi:hypothetical protein